MNPPSASEMGVGSVLRETYELTALLGEGGMGRVFLARHRRLPGRQVAIKVLQNGASQHPDLLARFRREAEIASRLGHPNIVEVLDFDTLPDGTPFLVMEYLCGESLEARLRRGRLPLAEALALTRQMGSALQAAHRAGVVHRDLKPANVFLVPTDSEGAERVKLLDFGISKMREEGELSVTLTRSSLGTPLYMSPEQIRSARSADARADIWSLGVILYELLTGKPPFDGEGPSGVIASITADPPVPPIELRPELSKSISDCVLKALEKSPARRYQSVAELAEALLPFGPPGAWLPPATASSPSTPRISLSDIPRVNAEAITEPAPQLRAEQSSISDAKPAAGSRRPLALALLALLVVGATVIFFVTRSEPTPPPPVAAPAAPAPQPTQPVVGTPPVSEPEVAPELVTSVPATAAASEPSPKQAPARPRTKGVKSTPPAPETKKELPAPPPPRPPEPENPLHL
jgi:eukaryotic-like serine/threonine-protein kinase